MENKKDEILILAKKCGVKDLKGTKTELCDRIYNMFNNQNAITNTWVRDVNSKRQFAIPNFLTPRVFNVRLSARL